MTTTKLDLWFKSLELNELMRIFYCPSGQDANDFIDDCDEYWGGLNNPQKLEFYLRHKEFGTELA